MGITRGPKFRRRDKIDLFMHGPSIIYNERIFMEKLSQIMRISYVIFLGILTYKIK